MNFILCFGEFLLRFSPDLQGNWLRQNNLVIYAGGAEANVAAALAKWRLPVQYCTALPENYLSQQVLQFLRQRDIETSKIFYHGQKIGSYFLPADADLKHHSVIYDRNHSSFATLEPGVVDWYKILEGVGWLHFSAISPALSGNLATVCKEALVVAAEKKITVSVDLNYRSKLWQYGKNPNEIMPDLVSSCDLVMGNLWSAETMLNMPLDQQLKTKNSKELFIEQSRETSLNITRAFPRCKTVANTFRFEDGEKINYYATLFTAGKFYISSEYTADKVVDKVGSGDCFMAGLIYGNYHQLLPQDILEFATAAAFQKLFVKGDWTDKTINDIKSAIPK